MRALYDGVNYKFICLVVPAQKFVILVTSIEHVLGSETVVGIHWTDSHSGGCEEGGNLTPRFSVCDLVKEQMQTFE